VSALGPDGKSSKTVQIVLPQNQSSPVRLDFVLSEKFEESITVSTTTTTTASSSTTGLAPPFSYIATLICSYSFFNYFYLCSL